MTSATAVFTNADVGALVGGAGIPSNSSITNVISSTSVALNNAATATGSGVTLTIAKAFTKQSVPTCPSPKVVELFPGEYDGDGSGLHRWTLDEIRGSVRIGQPVIVQVVYRGLPGREDSGYYGDHYIIVTGLMGDNFLYNDPIGGQVAREAPGYDRLMSPAQLTRAMRASDTGYAYTAFGLSRN